MTIFHADIVYDSKIFNLYILAEGIFILSRNV